uniref:Reverse transcriptase Ty1/copia-type domain-containing protein n=1 Tax=Solanum lycopersicum TaxID=4081 RepID=A0A3Q7EWH6_SOLLC
MLVTGSSLELIEEAKEAFQKVFKMKDLGELKYFLVCRLHLNASKKIYSRAYKKYGNDVALRVVRYLKGQPGQGLLFGSSSNSLITAFYDVDWASCPLSRRTVTGYAIKIGEALLSWKAKKIDHAEAEYRSLASTISELVWLLEMLK